MADQKERLSIEEAIRLSKRRDKIAKNQQVEDEKKQAESNLERELDEDLVRIREEEGKEFERQRLESTIKYDSGSSQEKEQTQNTLGPNSDVYEPPKYKQEEYSTIIQGQESDQVQESKSEIDKILEKTTNMYKRNQ